MPSRRELLKAALTAAASLGAPPWLPRFGTGTALADDGVPLGPPELPSGTREGASLRVLAGKKPLIRRTARPPNYETPLSHFREVFTPNDVFFVRYHLPGVPEVDARSWTLKVSGESVERPVELSLSELKKGFEPVEVPALCYCAGNRRGLFQPHVPGIQWGCGAMGNAVWKGVRLRDVLGRTGLRKDALEVAADGAEAAPGKVPDFVKSLPVWKALDEDTILAYEMNGEPLPRWNGFPVRLVVPGWASSYWIKHLTSIEVSPRSFQGFWMNPAYRIPKGVFATVDRFVSQETETTVPVTDLVVNSIITSPLEGQKLKPAEAVTARGFAWDGGRGISRVEFSLDGEPWRSASLGKEQGRFSWRAWSCEIPAPTGAFTIEVRAFNRIGQTQTNELLPSPSGYHHNLIHRVTASVG